MATPPASHRTKASAIRKKLAAGQDVSTSDQIWLSEYEEATNGSGNFGAAKSSTKVHRTETIEEEKAAVGTGTAAATAAGLALVTREEGRRIDSLTVNAIAALKEAVEVYKTVCLTLLDQRKADADQNKENNAAHVEMMKAYRGELLSRIDLEADLREKESEKEPDGTTAMAIALVAKHLGIEIPTVGAPKKNGAPKKTAA